MLILSMKSCPQLILESFLQIYVGSITIPSNAFPAVMISATKERLAFVMVYSLDKTWTVTSAWKLCP